MRARVEVSACGFALVLSDTGVLLGRLRGAMLEGDPDARAGDVMEPGPSTVRPSEELAALAERLGERGLNFAIVTSPEGRLIGIVRRSRADELLAK